MLYEFVARMLAHDAQVREQNARRQAIHILARTFMHTPSTLGVPRLQLMPRRQRHAAHCCTRARRGEAFKYNKSYLAGLYFLVACAASKKTRGH